MHITFIQTGGTIDKDYPRGETNHGYNFEITEPAFASIVPHSHPLFDYEFLSVLKKDSLDITQEDRQAIYDAVSKLETNHVVITHGTDTMHLTAEKLSSIPDKTIVLTGAMLPEKFVTSDARFNIGMAVSAVQTLPPGIYVALYGRVVPWKEFRQVNQEFEERAKTFATQGTDHEK